MLRALHTSVNQTGWQFIICDGVNYYIASPVFMADAAFQATYSSQWLHLAGTFKGGTFMGLYFNGSLIASKTTGVPSQMTPDTATKNWIARTGVNPGYLNGLIDEVRVYNRAFDGGEVSFSNANPGLPPTRGLVAWYPMDEGTNVPFSFTAGSSYALTITAYSLDGGFFTVTTAAECR